MYRNIAKLLACMTLLLPAGLCIIAQGHHFDFGRIMLDAVLILAGFVGIKVFLHQIDIKNHAIVFAARELFPEKLYWLVLLISIGLSGYLCIMSVVNPAMEFYQIPAFYLLAVFAMRINHKAVYLDDKTLYYDFAQYPRQSLRIQEQKDDGKHASFHLVSGQRDFWVIVEHRQAEALEKLLKEK